MEREVFNGSTIDECIEKACNKYNVLKEDIKYEVIEVKNGIFKKKASIAVEIVDKSENKESENKKDGTIQILDGKIVVKDPVEGGKSATIVVPKNIGVKVNDKDVKDSSEVCSSSNIEVVFSGNRKTGKKNKYKHFTR
ncbi:Jag N-terminal domain-containing protein [Clostridium acetobutylicum]|uniref:Jag N-terminal domain-containing protein n=1 Tax=Clostridium acetobutylicum TaxID=1488 RepID=UPI00180321DB|nr:Jag N-terminal domain-containing protein [Clostridium acetobutylicum]NYC93841.1 putative RNA-binding protein Jag [Clostridium acetobutylicum]